MTPQPHVVSRWLHVSQVALRRAISSCLDRPSPPSISGEDRGCEPGVTRDGRVFRFCKQPLEVVENVRNEPDPLQIFGGLRLKNRNTLWQKLRPLTRPHPPHFHIFHIICTANA